MIVYQNEKRQFIEDVVTNTIEHKILAQFQAKLNRTTSANEIASWRNSMMYMQNVLMDPDIRDECGVAIEYAIPLTSKRIDFILHHRARSTKLRGLRHAQGCHDHRRTHAGPLPG